MSHLLSVAFVFISAFGRVLFGECDDEIFVFVVRIVPFEVSVDECLPAVRRVFPIHRRIFLRLVELKKITQNKITPCNEFITAKKFENT